MLGAWRCLVFFLFCLPAHTRLLVPSVLEAATFISHSTVHPCLQDCEAFPWLKYWDICTSSSGQPRGPEYLCPVLGKAKSSCSQLSCLASILIPHLSPARCLPDGGLWACTGGCCLH